MRRMVLAVALWSASLALADTTSTYTVRVGDTLYAISRAHGSSVPELMTLTGLVSHTVQVG